MLVRVATYTTKQVPERAVLAARGRKKQDWWKISSSWCSKGSAGLVYQDRVCVSSESMVDSILTQTRKQGNVCPFAARRTAPRSTARHTLCIDSHVTVQSMKYKACGTAVQRSQPLSLSILGFGAHIHPSKARISPYPLQHLCLLLHMQGRHVRVL